MYPYLEQGKDSGIVEATSYTEEGMRRSGHKEVGTPRNALRGRFLAFGGRYPLRIRPRQQPGVGAGLALIRAPL